MATADANEDDCQVFSRNCRGYERSLEQNWCGNVRFNGTPVVPDSLADIREIVRRGSAPIRVIGRGHSFTPLAECEGGTLISLERLNQVLAFVPPSGTEGRLGSITVEGGITYTEVAQFLGERGALRNLPSCPQFTVAGAIATGTHGSGIRFSNLAADVSMIEFIVADGSTQRYDLESSPALLEGARVHLGCLGVIVALTLDVVPFFEVDSYRYEDLPLETTIESLPELWRSCDSLSVWTSGFGRGPGAGTCWATFRHFIPHCEGSAIIVPPHTDSTSRLGGGALVRRPLERYCTDVENPVRWNPTGRGPWYDALTLTSDQGRETSMATVDLQAEFFVPLESAKEAIRAVQAVTSEWTFSSPHGHVGEKVKGLVDAMEFRQVRGDGAWMSPQPVDSLGIHISFNGDPVLRTKVLHAVRDLEDALESFGATAHWAKLAPKTHTAARVEERYGEKLQRFRALCDAHDPRGKFRNVHVDRTLFGDRGLLQPAARL